MFIAKVKYIIYANCVGRPVELQVMDSSRFNHLSSDLRLQCDVVLSIINFNLQSKTNFD